ncbi:unnamed protein product [Mycena citricolor]|uniref:Protein-tyrosine-phosphatase n=1 Tax=Mycena citricolor TaxID=2018698 RepID=A0AAD2HF49_9AGAR|nr:unnamed protein product [Mycena citricolor]
MLSFAAPSWNTAVFNARSRKTRQASLIIPRLYLSDAFTAKDEQELAKLKITHVITIADRSEANIQEHFVNTTQFISSALEENEDNIVLVHCFQGISRSATIVCAYLVAVTTMTPTEALVYVQSKRTVVCPNLGFRNQLEQWGAQFKDQKKRGSVVSRTLGGISDRLRELKAAAGAPPSTKKLIIPRQPVGDNI